MIVLPGATHYRQAATKVDNSGFVPGIPIMVDKDRILNALQNMKPKSKAAQIHDLLPAIEEQRRRGVPLTEIVALLKKEGLIISRRTLSTYLSRWRKTQGESAAPATEVKLEEYERLGRKRKARS